MCRVSLITNIKNARMQVFNLIVKEVRRQKLTSCITTRKLTLTSHAPTAKPIAAPEPASPIKCSLPILLTKSEAPTYQKTILIFEEDEREVALAFKPASIDSSIPRLVKFSAGCYGLAIAATAILRCAWH